MYKKIFQRKLAEYFEENLPSYLGILRQMVSINSFTARASAVNELGSVTAEIFGELGFNAERIPSLDPRHGDHLILTKIGHDDEAPTIGLISHLDTVFTPEEELSNDFSWRIDAGRAYGPGTVDIKGGTVIIFMILSGLRALAPEAFAGTNWLILMNAAEETLDPQFGKLCLEIVPNDALACLVFEGGRQQGTSFSVVTARKGMATYQIVVGGRAAHAGSAHHNGANAIVQLARTVSQVAEMTDYEKGITYNIGTIEGGTVTNRVPHQASSFGEMRAYSPEVLNEGVAQLQALQDEVQVHSNNGNYKCEVDISIINQWRPWPPNEATRRLLAVWQDAALSLGFEVIAQERGGLSDGNWIWDHVPTLDGLGPSGGNAHCSERSADGKKDQEYVQLSSLVPKALLNSVAILNLLGHKM
jgi:glutamate carboxypeptidase